jgi:hypothetical protein
MERHTTRVNVESPNEEEEEAGLLKKFAAMRVCTCDCYQKLTIPSFDWSLDGIANQVQPRLPRPLPLQHY